MSEFTLDDGRKAEKVENNLDPMTKVIEVYVEPKKTKRLSQRITERFCVCERVVETIDEDSGEVVESVVENLCGSEVKAVAPQSKKSPIQMAVESKLKGDSLKRTVAIGAIIAVQVLALVYVIFFM